MIWIEVQVSMRQILPFTSVHLVVLKLT